MTDRDDNEQKPDDSTEEYLLGGLDEGAEADEPGEYVEQPTEEVFALEARLLEGDDVPELDPVFRAALLESPEKAAPDPPAGDPAEDSAEQEIPETGETGEQTAEHTAEHDQGTAEWDPPSEDSITAEQTAILSLAAKSEVNKAIDESRRTGESWDPARPTVGGDFQPPGKRRRYWWRFMLATLIIVFSFASATSASILNIVGDLSSEISGENIVPPGVLPDSNGGPQTIAILGSDVRTGGGAPTDDPGRSDTTLLLRLDPDSGQIAMLSIPRDLKAEIPGYGTDKFNAAFSYGGPALTIKTIKSVTGLDINHVINVDFQGFAEVVDALHCVFVDVDQEYYHSNEGLAAAEQYAEIDIDAGYQKLCGEDALDFARYRHGDSDLARAARQQDLVGEVRNRLSIDEFIKQRKELISAFADNTKSDISGTDEPLEILKLLFDSRDASVVEVKFPATLTDDNGISYVEATPNEIQTAVDQFLGFEDQTGPVGTLAEGDSKKNRDERKKKKKKNAESEDRVAKSPTKENDGLVDASTGGLEVAKSLDSEFKRSDFSVFYPKRLPAGTIYSDGGRTYHLRDPDKNPYAAYRMVMALQLDDGLHYFGLQAIRGWSNPPILDAPREELTMDDRDFNVYWEGDRIRLISWSDGDNTYWISNSILLTLENDQMLGMARSTRGFTAA